MLASRRLFDLPHFRSYVQLMEILSTAGLGSETREMDREGNFGGYVGFHPRAVNWCP